MRSRQQYTVLIRISAAGIVALGLFLTAAVAPAQEAPQETLRFAAPFEVAEAKKRTFDEPFLLTVAGQPVRVTEALELRLVVNSADLAKFPPALQPRLFIGRSSYEIHRVEYSNWNLEKEVPIDPREPVAEFSFIYVFVPDSEQIERGQPMILTVLSPAELARLLGQSMDLEALRRALPGTRGIIPRFEPD